MKRKIITLILAASVGLSLAACGSASSASSSASDTSGMAQSTAFSSEEVSGTSASKAQPDTSDSSSSDTVIIGETSMVESIDPTNSGDPWSLTADGISETLYKQDENGNLVSHLADSVTQDDANTWTLKLKEGMKFSDGSPVDAQAVSDCINDIMSNNQMATASCGVITATPKDDTTVTLSTERTTTVMESVLCEWTNVIYKKNQDGTYLFTGPYMLKNLDPGVTMELTPNPYYDDQASKRPNVILKKFEDTTAMQQAFEAGEIDMAFTVTPDTAAALEGEGYTVKTIDAGYQYFSILNMAKDPLSDLHVREAINLAMNRDDMITALQGGRVATGFFASYYPFDGDVKEKTDTDAAKKDLATAGYTDSDGDGYLDKDGKKLSLSLITYASRPDLTTLMQLAADELNDLGIDVSTKIVDGIDDVLASGDYDIAFYAQHTAPTGEPAYALNQFFRTGEGKNNNGYSNTTVDSLLDKIGTLPAGDERNKLAKEVQQQIYEDLPVVYLIDPQWHIAVSDKLANYTPYCGDYYVVNDQLGLD